jgi:tRNA 2-selenouridine synthase
MELPQVDNFHQLIIDEIPFIDVRAPVEYAKGTLPTAENHPLINDEERHQIGIEYAELGQDKAIDLGHELVKGDTKAARVAAWKAFAEAHPDGVLYCWRGGMRSKISQQWLYEKTGILYPRIKGGYKAVRRYLIDEMERVTPTLPMVIIGGRTGVGKTRFLLEFNATIDLEGLANHRGSAFGPRVEPQPSQTDFENQLAIAVIKHLARTAQIVLLEDEGRSIGSRAVPESFNKRMKESPLILLEVPEDERIAITHQEYIHDALVEHCVLYGDVDGFEKWSEYLLGSLDKIQKRLGGVRHQEIRAELAAAIDLHRTNGDTELHKSWIKTLLIDYYDPMYDYQIEKNRERIVFKGDKSSVTAYLKENWDID